MRIVQLQPQLHHDHQPSRYMYNCLSISVPVLFLSVSSAKLFICPSLYSSLHSYYYLSLYLLILNIGLSPGVNLGPPIFLWHKFPLPMRLQRPMSAKSCPYPSPSPILCKNPGSAPVLSGSVQTSLSHLFIHSCHPTAICVLILSIFLFILRNIRLSDYLRIRLPLYLTVFPLFQIYN